MSKDISIQEIARLAGVSKTTVSRVINNRSEVNAETRKKVEAVIEKYDYYPNARAQMFSQQRTKNVGLVFTHDEAYTLSNPYYAELLQGILEKARETGYHVILTYLLKNDCFSLVRSRSVDGLLILTPGSGERKKLEELQKLGIPIVSTARVPGMKNLPYVAVDEYNASYQSIEYLIKLGHKKIAMINGPRSLYSTSQRLLGYKDALKNYGIPYDSRLIVYGDTSVSDGSGLMKKLLYADIGITAALVGSDMMVIGAHKAITERGLAVPRDISLISTDGTEIASCLDLPPTTFKQPTRRRGQLSMGMLVDLIEGNKTETSITIPMDIILNKSIGQLNENK